MKWLCPSYASARKSAFSSITLTEIKNALMIDVAVDDWAMYAKMVSDTVINAQDPYASWQQTKNVDGLKKSACALLQLPAVVTSADSVFSVLGAMLTDRQASMAPEHVRQLLVLKCNVDLARSFCCGAAR